MRPDHASDWRRHVLATCLLLAAPAIPCHPSESPPMPAIPSESATTTCCAVIELRQYTLHPFKRDVLVDLFDREFVEPQEAVGMRVIATFRDLGNPDRFVWLRGFPGMAARRDSLQAFYGGPVWQAHRDAANGTMIDSDNVMLLKPARMDSRFVVDDRPLPPHDAVAIPPGLVEARLYYLDGAPSQAQLDLVEAVRPVLERAGAEQLATLVTESAENTFPRLPVRVGEPVIAWFTQFRDREAYDRYLTVLDASPQWRRAEGALLRAAPRAPDVLLLAPTARSRIPHVAGSTQP